MMRLGLLLLLVPVTMSLSTPKEATHPEILAPTHESFSAMIAPGSPSAFRERLNNETAPPPMAPGIYTIQSAGAILGAGYGYRMGSEEAAKGFLAAKPVAYKVFRAYTQKIHVHANLRWLVTPADPTYRVQDGELTLADPETVRLYGWNNQFLEGKVNADGSTEVNTSEEANDNTLWTIKPSWFSGHGKYLHWTIQHKSSSKYLVDKGENEWVTLEDSSDGWPNTWPVKPEYVWAFCYYC